jgi:hypothetical protein
MAMHDRRTFQDPFARKVRRHPRIEIDGELLGTGVTSDLDVEFRNISLGGFLTVSATAVPPGSLELFVVPLPDAQPVHLRAEAIHGQPANRKGTAHFTGWKAQPDDNTQAGLRRLLDYLSTSAATAVV